ncbi:MAG: regulatory protein RecX [bacterium]|nr:regulatory protein RecX [bacterium]
MPTITAISPQKKHRNRYSIFVDNQFYAGVDTAVVENLGLRKGLEVDTKKLATILEQEEYQRAKNYLFRLLSRRLYSCAEVRKKLNEHGFGLEIKDKRTVGRKDEGTEKQDTNPDLIEQLITEFTERGWLDDTQFALQWTESRLRLKPCGLGLIRRELLQKGIEKELIDEVLAKYTDSEAEFDRALAALNKKKNYTNEPDPIKRKRKIYSYLARRGFSSDIIEKLMNQLT